MLHRYGSGEYTIWLNDQVTKKGREANVALCTISERNFQEHPPIIEPGTLVLDDPANRSYIEYLKIKGVEIPGLEEDYMRQDTSASDRLAETVERMADQNIRLAGEAVKAAGKQEKPPEQARSSDQDTLLTSMKIVQQATDMGTRIVEQAVSKAGEITGRAGDPSQMLKSLGDLLAVVRAQPGGGDSATSAILQQQIARASELEARLFQVQTAHLQSVEAMLRDAQAKQVQLNPQPGQPQSPTSPSQYIKDMADAKEAMERFIGREPEEATRSAKEPWWSTLARMALAVIPSVAAAAVALSHNAAVARGGQGRPIGPGDIQQVQPAAEEPATTIQTPPGTAAEGQPQSELPKDQQAMQTIHMFLGILREPLLKSLDNDETGDTFAGNLVALHGWTMYNYLHNMGPDSLVTILASYPPIWSVISRIPEKFQQYLSEFMAYGDMAKEQAGEEEAAQDPSQTAPKPEVAPHPAEMTEGQEPAAADSRHKRRVKVN